MTVSTFQGKFKYVLCVFQGCLNNFYGCLMNASSMVEVCFEEGERTFKECFKGIGKKVSKVFQGSFSVSGKSQYCVQSVSK